MYEKIKSESSLLFPRTIGPVILILSFAFACGGAAKIQSNAYTLSEATEALWPGSGRGGFHPPTEQQRRAFAELIARLWRGILPSDGAQVQQLVRLADKELLLWRVGSQPTWVVRDRAASARGQGVYLIRATRRPPGRSILLQAPHVYFDLWTQEIAAGMLWGAESPAEIRGVFANSVHRYGRPKPGSDLALTNSADVAHNSLHPFLTATAAIARQDSVVVIQLHGFDGSSPTPSVEAIVSASRVQGSTTESTRVSTSLLDTVGGKVVRFPEDVTFLGGVNNVQARLLAATPGAEFVHVELSPGLRERLREPQLAAQWARTLVRHLGREGQ